MQTSQSNVLDAVQCPYCARPGTLAAKGDCIHCEACNLDFPIVDGVLNTLVRADGEVLREIAGMMEEARHRGESFASPEAYMVRRVDRLTTIAEREKSLEGQPNNYYRSTRLNLEQALAHIDMSGEKDGRRKRVLEIGGDNEMPFLSAFRDKGWDCYVTNIHFFYSDPAAFRAWPTKVLGDMNHLPFRDAHFDVVITSATTHHSPDLGRTISEIARVTAPGGDVLIINEPTRAPLKHRLQSLSGGNDKGGNRVELIHENEYPASDYIRLLKQNGVKVRASMLSANYDQKLRSGDVKGIRWSVLARPVSVLWRMPPLRYVMARAGLWIGQRTIGLELNFVARKAKGPAAGTKRR